MNSQERRSDLRVAIISTLVKKAHPHPLGRTAIMKLVYFLQALHKVPLGYDFRIYTYGPYDSQVLEDLKVAELKGALRSSAVGYAVGTGYAITPGPAVDEVVDRARSIQDFISKVALVLGDFGNRSAIDLEMSSTLVFVDQAEFSSDFQALARKVKEMKPRLEIANIVQEAKLLKKKGYIK